MCKPKALGGMGFKDLEKFNEAMLAKQVWRLLVDKSSLFYRVFSAKYFSNGSVFDAKAASRSFAWKSIVKASKLVQSGLLWRVGNGSKINIYNNMWLPRRASACVVSPRIEGVSNWSVAKLLEPGEGGWNEQLLDDIFLPFEAQRIKSIPLCVTDQEDCLFWSRCRSGSYSVKFGYQLLCETKMISLLSSSNLEVIKRFWKDIWRLKVPNKVKVFLWCTCSRALLTKVNLQKRRVVDNSTCDQCGCMAEDEFHTLWDCEMVREAWAPAFREVRRKGKSLKVMSNLVSVTKAEGLSLELFAMTAWLI